MHFTAETQRREVPQRGTKKPLRNLASQRLSG